MKPAIFKDTEVQACFDKDGYVVIDFISSEEAKIIADKFYELHLELPKGFYSAAHNPDEEFKEAILAITEKVTQKAMDLNFQSYKKLGSTFLCKAPGQEGKVNVHQDWTTVDESNFYSATIWIPMLDTNEENGTLRVLPGSHLFFDYYRSKNIPFCYRGNEDLLWDNMITVPMKAGQAFILNHAVLHASSPNITSKERLVVASAIVPKEASLIFYHKNAFEKSDKIEKFDMPDDFFQRYHNEGERPLFGTLVKEFDYPDPATSREELIELIGKERRVRNMSPVFDAKQNGLPHKQGSELKHVEWIDDRGFFEKFTPLNIIEELKKKILQKT